MTSYGIDPGALEFLGRHSDKQNLASQPLSELVYIYTLSRAEFPLKGLLMEYCQFQMLLAVRLLPVLPKLTSRTTGIINKGFLDIYTYVNQY